MPVREPTDTRVLIELAVHRRLEQMRFASAPIREHIMKEMDRALLAGVSLCELGAIFDRALQEMVA